MRNHSQCSWWGRLEVSCGKYLACFWSHLLLLWSWRVFQKGRCLSSINLTLRKLMILSNDSLMWKESMKSKKKSKMSSRWFKIHRSIMSVELSFIKEFYCLESQELAKLWLQEQLQENHKPTLSIAQEVTLMRCL